jgi:hypothetical protein
VGEISESVHGGLRQKYLSVNLNSGDFFGRKGSKGQNGNDMNKNKDLNEGK